MDDHSQFTKCSMGKRCYNVMKSKSAEVKPETYRPKS